jgi:hypothetical protein
MRDNYLLTPLQNYLRCHFAKTNLHRQTRDTPIVLIQCAEDYFHFVLFGEIIEGLRACGLLRVDVSSFVGLRSGSSLSLRQMFWNSVRLNFLSDWKWRRLYGAFADRTAYRAMGWLFPWTALTLWWAAWRLWRGLETVNDLAQLTVREIWIGDLIIDSYIRFKPAPAPALNDLYLLVIIRQALKDIRKSDGYFRRNRPALLLTSYTTYIQHGIPARVAAQKDILVRAFSNLQDFATDITRDNFWNSRDGKNYKTDFSVFPDKTSKLAAAERQLKDRLNGKFDAATSYMKTSAYGRASETQFDVQGMPVIFLHDFYDSVHVYRWVCFHDFWSWACFTIDTLRAAKIAFAVKPHPNQIAGSSDVLDQLLEKYQDLAVIPVNVTNDQLVRSGMTCAVTVYGTVASEMAFMGVPTISCGDNPHVSFDFCHTARTREEYATLLLSHSSLSGTPAEMRRESCIFYYMHNLNLNQDQQTLKDKILELRRRLFFIDSTPSPQEVIDAAADFASGPALQEFCSSLYRIMQENGAHEDSGPRAMPNAPLPGRK